jgi:hypothetical protein
VELFRAGEHPEPVDVAREANFDTVLLRSMNELLQGLLADH